MLIWKGYLNSNQIEYFLFFATIVCEKFFQSSLIIIFLIPAFLQS